MTAPSTPNRSIDQAGRVNRAINQLESITYYKHHYIRKTGVKKIIKELLADQRTALIRDLLERMPKPKTEILRGKDSGMARIGSPEYAHNQALTEVKVILQEYGKGE